MKRSIQGSVANNFAVPFPYYISKQSSDFIIYAVSHFQCFFILLCYKVNVSHLCPV